MGERKRKGAASIDVPAKKSKQSKLKSEADIPEPQTAAPVLKVEPDTKVSSSAADNLKPAISKKSRKRAADFMTEEEEVTVEPQPYPKSKKSKTQNSADSTTSKPKSSKKNKKGQQGDLLTADGVNGVLEHSGHEELEIATSHKPIFTSMQAEAERTLDQELKDEFGGLSEKDEEASADEVDAEDNAGALLAGFDSDTDDKYEDENLDSSASLKLSKQKGKEVSKRLSEIQSPSNSEGPGTVYVGRIPHGFYETQMHEYFSQFGEISKLRLSRNKHTGASKHFAFIEFASNEVAKIVAETMDNYLLFGHLLKCKYAQPDSLHPDVWKGANKKFRKIPHEKLEREKLAAPKSEAQWEKKVGREKRRRARKGKKLASIGLELPTSTLTAPSDALKRQRLEAAEEEARKQIEDINEGPAGLIEPPHGLPKDEVAIKEEAKQSEEMQERAGGTKSKRIRSRKRKSIPDSIVDASTGSTLEVVEASTDDTSKVKVEESNKKAKKVKKALPEAVEEALIAGASEPVIEAAEDFIALAVDAGKDDQSPTSNQGNTTVKPKKEKKDRKNLVKAKGPKSGLVSTKAPSQPSPKSNTAGIPTIGKNKYDKTKRQENKRAKQKGTKP